MSPSEYTTPPLVAIVGRPNVGKSTLFNRLVGHRIAVVHSEAGTTRDRIQGDVCWDDTCFQLVDTGGLLPGVRQGLDQKVAEQVEMAIREAAVCLLVVDIQEGLTPLDEAVGMILRRQGRKVILVANKADNQDLELGAGEFMKLGFERCLPVSAMHGLGVNDILDAIVAAVERYPLSAGREGTSLAIVGRPNVGKSTLFNRLLGTDRVVVDDRPGTTRDAVDAGFQWEGQEFRVVDTAGLLRHNDSRSALDFFSLSRTRRGIKSSDVTLLLLETPHPPTRTDANFVKLALDSGKGCILGVNKWDLAGFLSRKKYRETVRNQLPFAGFLPIVFFSARDGKGIEDLMGTVMQVAGLRQKTVSTALLNRVLQQAQEQVPARRRKHTSLKIYYAAQTGTAPPSFRLFVNDPRLLSSNYENYLENAVRRAFGFEGVPLRFSLKRRRH